MRKETWPVRRRHAAHIGRIQPGFWQGYVQRRECNITGKNGKEMQKKKLWIFFWSPLLFREVYESESDELVCWWNWVFRIYLPLFNTTPVGGLCRGVEKESKSRGFSNFRSPFFPFQLHQSFLQQLSLVCWVACDPGLPKSGGWQLVASARRVDCRLLDFLLWWTQKFALQSSASLSAREIAERHGMRTVTISL